MSTVGTLYEKTIKNGYAKLLAIQDVVSPVANISFVAPFTSTYDNYIFDIDSLQSDNTGAYFLFYPSVDSGASWLQSELLWSLAGVWSHRAVQTYGSTIYPGARVYMQQTYDAQYGPLPMSGTIYFNRGPPGSGGEKQFFWMNTYRSPSYGSGFTWGNGAANSSYALMTGIRFAYSSGNIIAGAIRVYGIKMGV
jgi:hypothetical protein